jgi:hypothetical protein
VIAARQTSVAFEASAPSTVPVVTVPPAPAESWPPPLTPPPLLPPKELVPPTPPLLVAFPPWSPGTGALLLEWQAAKRPKAATISMLGRRESTERGYHDGRTEADSRKGGAKEIEKA